MSLQISCKKILVNALGIILLAFTACKKDAAGTSTTPPVTPPDGSFSWIVNGGTATITADSAFYRAAFKTIFAYKNIGVS